MDLNRLEFIANMRGGPFPLQDPHGWHPGETDPRPFHLQPHGNGPYFQKFDVSPRMKGASNGPESPPTPEYFQVNPSFPPGFENGHIDTPGFHHGHRNLPGFDNSHSFHGETNFQESLEITSDRPFLPRRRAIPEGGPSELLPHDKTKMRRKTKFSPPIMKDAQPAQADTSVSASVFQKARPPSLRSSILGEPPVPRSDGATVQESATEDFEQATIECQKCWEKLSSAYQQRERVFREKEQSFKKSTINKDALEEEKNQAAAMKNAIMEERRKLKEEAQRIREEKDAMERTSTDIAVQMVELKQVQKQLEKEKAALLALKADLSTRERDLQEQDCVEAAVTALLVAVKAEIEEPVINRCGNCGQSCTHDSQNQEPQTVMDVPSVSELSPMASNRNFEFVKVKFVTSGSDAAHRDTSRLDDNSSEDDMDDLPLAYRLKSQRVEKTGENRKLGEKTKQQEESSTWNRQEKKRSLIGKNLM